MKKINKKTIIKVILVTILTMFFAATIYATATNSYKVTINVNGEAKSVITLKDSADDVLAQAGIKVGENDIIDFSKFKSGSECEITVYKLANVKIYDDSEAGTELNIAGTVETAFKTLGISLNEEDKINCKLTDTLTDGMKIKITRAFPVTISVDGEIVKVNLTEGTVSDALDKAVITFDDDDVISKPLNTPLSKGMTIKVTHVEYKERTEKTVIPFTTKSVNDASLYKGQSKIKQAGVNGEKVVTYKEKYVDGKLKESVAVKTEITKKAVEEIKLTGTKSNGAVVFTNGTGGTSASSIRTISTLTPPSNLKLNGTAPVSYRKKIVGTASGYSSDAITATGKACQPGYIAVNPNQISYGTKMWIVSNDGAYVYGYASAEDTGGFIYWTGNRATVADLFFDTEAQAEAFGRRTVTIYIL